MTSTLAFLRAATLKDLRRRLADPAALAIWIGIPLALGGLMALAFGGSSGPAPRAHVLWVDRDGSLLSSLLVRLATGGPMLEFVEIEEVAEEEGRRRIEEGDATALLVLPDGHQDALLNGRPATLTLITNPAQRILPAIVEEGLDIFVEGAFYAQQLFGDLLREMAAGPSGGEPFPTNAQVAELSARINDRLRALQPVLTPPVLSLEFPDTTPTGTDALNFGALFLPGVVLMSVLFIAQGLSGDIWEEEEQGTLRRFKTTPQPMSAWLGGKLLTGGLLIAAVAVAAAVIAIALFDVAPLRAPGVVLWAAFAGIAILAYFMLLQTAATSPRGGNLVGSLIVFPLMMIGGSFFPFETMPSWMAAIGRWTPNGLAVVRLEELLFGNVQPGSIVTSALAIGVPAALAFVFASRRLARRFGAR